MQFYLKIIKTFNEDLKDGDKNHKMLLSDEIKISYPHNAIVRGQSQGAFLRDVLDSHSVIY